MNVNVFFEVAAPYPVAQADGKYGRRIPRAMRGNTKESIINVRAANYMELAVRRRSSRGDPFGISSGPLDGYSHHYQENHNEKDDHNSTSCFPSRRYLRSDPFIGSASQQTLPG